MELTKKIRRRLALMRATEKIEDMSVKEYRKNYDEFLGICAGAGECPISDEDIRELAFEMQDIIRDEEEEYEERGGF